MIIGCNILKIRASGPGMGSGHDVGSDGINHNFTQQKSRKEHRHGVIQKQLLRACHCGAFKAQYAMRNIAM